MTREECIKILGNPDTHPGAEWDGYTVDIPDLDGIVGLPLVILTKDGDSHISDPDEAIDYLAYTRPAYTGKANSWDED